MVLGIVAFAMFYPGDQVLEIGDTRINRYSLLSELLVISLFVFVNDLECFLDLM